MSRSRGCDRARRSTGGLAWLLLAATLLLFCKPAGAETIVVGSKRFTESYILAEIMAQLLEQNGFAVERKFGLGGTLICYEALRGGDIDVYPEYSGTLEQAILKSDRRMSYAQLKQTLSVDHDLDLLHAFGFDNTYAIAVRRDVAASLELEGIGDLSAKEGLRYAFSHEFLNRNDGWPRLAAVYELRARPRGIEHGLAYQAIAEGRIDVTDVYSTDGDILKYDLKLLRDDEHYFPLYLAAPLAREGLDPVARDILVLLRQRIDGDQMRRMNARVLLDGLTFSTVASEFVRNEFATTLPGGNRARSGFWWVLGARVLTHLKLTLIALVGAMLIAIPLGVMVYRLSRVSRVVVYFAGTLQTIPSIALLAFMIPVFGIGVVPAIVALFLYALLPILRNTTAALFTIDPVLKNVATGMGLTPGQRLRYVEIPLAVPTILAGVKTAAVINIGTATLAAFIGAGGLGEPIVTGLALNDTRLILQGAIPAALLAVVTELAFEGIERAVVPRHLLAKHME